MFSLFQVLLALILAGSSLQISQGSEKKGQNSDVKYKGPVVYTNLPPPVLYFPKFPEHPKLSNRGSSGDSEDKRVEYVPFPYKDLPLLVYQSQNQPPVHVVEKTSKQDSEKENTGTGPQSNPGYQSGPAVYRVAENNEYDNEEADSTNHPQALIPNPSEKFINVGLSTSQVPPISSPNQQIISIGVTSIQPPGGDLHSQSSSTHSIPSHIPQQSNDFYSQVQYSGSQNNENFQYPSQISQNVGQNIPGFTFYTNQQYAAQTQIPQAQVPIQQITQAIQNYLLQQNGGQQIAPSGIHQNVVSYPSGTQSDPITSSSSSPTQHVGITIIRPAVSDSSPEHGGDATPQGPYNPPLYQFRYPQDQISNDQGYGDNQQYVSIGVFPINLPGNAGNNYNQDTQQYYNIMAPVQNDQYQNTNEDYRQVNQDYQNSVSGMNENQNGPQTTGYQLISIDLSALRNKNAEQQRNNYPEYSQQSHQQSISAQGPVDNRPPQNYRAQNQNEGPYSGREKEFQQILIQIPHNILSESTEKPQHERSPFETPYTGTAQVANVLGDSNKVHNAPPSNNGPVYNRQPSNMQQQEKPRSPHEGFGFPQSGGISNGINIAIIKQSGSASNPPTYKRPPLERRPPVTENHPPPNHQNQRHIPRFQSQNIPQRPQGSYGPRVKLFPPNNGRFNRGQEMPPFPSGPFPAASMRYPHQPFGPHKNKPMVIPHGDHPRIYASSNIHYSTMSPPIMRPQLNGNAYGIPAGSSPYPHASATKNHPNFVQNPVAVPAPFNPLAAGATLHAFTNNISNTFGEISFDEINAFLSPSYDLFGSMTHGQNKKKVEDENNMLQTITSDILTHQDIAAIGMAGALPPYPVVKPPPHVLNVPFPYKYWEHPIRNFGPQGVINGRDQTRLMMQYSHMQYPYAGGKRPFRPFRRGLGKKRGLKGYRGLKTKLEALRTSIRHKSKISPRHEITNDETSEKGIKKTVSDFITDSIIFDNVSPRSTIIKTDRPELDGITIPLHPDRVLSSRVSNEEEEEEKKVEKLPPIIVYKGSKPPIEIYGTKADIEDVGKDNETEKEDSITSSDDDKIEDLSSDESVQTFSGQGIGYLDYMYSMLPDLIRGSLGRRHDEDDSKWLPVSPIEYSLADDAYDRNITNTENTEKAISPINLETVKESYIPQNTSTNAESTIEENIEELFSLLGKEEKSDVVKE